MPPDPAETLAQQLKQALQKANYFNIPEHKVRLLLADILDLTLPELALHTDLILNNHQKALFSMGLKRLLEHEPLQYILGKADFYGLVVEVDENVLIPRPETEGLVEWIIKREKKQLRILDIGTGSGAIALALKHLKPEFAVIGTDISSSAVSIARKNAQRLNLDVRFIKADLFPRFPKFYDLIVSNPPYVSKREYACLDEEIRQYEPGIALIASDKGLEYYRRILTKVSVHLTKQGKVYLEIGETQAQDVSAIAMKHGFIKIETGKDLAGKNRYLCLSH